MDIRTYETYILWLNKPYPQRTNLHHTFRPETRVEPASRALADARLARTRGRATRASSRRARVSSRAIGLSNTGRRECRTFARVEPARITRRFAPRKLFNLASRGGSIASSHDARRAHRFRDATSLVDASDVSSSVHGGSRARRRDARAAAALGTSRDRTTTRRVRWGTRCSRDTGTRGLYYGSGRRTYTGGWYDES